MQNRMEKCRVRGYTMIIDSSIFRACASFSQRINKMILSLKFNTLDFIIHYIVLMYCELPNQYFISCEWK